MNRRAFLGLAALAAPSFSQSAAAPVKAGFAEADITPEIGMEQPGGYGKVFHKALHDACKVRVAVFEDGARRVALIGIDALMIARPLVLAVRREITRQCGIPGEAVLIGASHSHSSGPTGMVQPGEYDGASPLARKLAYELSSCADPKYLALVERRLVEAVVAADRARAEARLGFGSGTEGAVAFNRRFRMKNGRTFTHPGQGNPDTIKAAGPIDPEVGIVGAWDREGRLTGCVVNYACHATTNPANGGISANWVYYLERSIRALYGDQVPVVFLQGACGDITQVNNLNPHKQPGSDDWARLVGGGVGAAASRAMLTVGRGTEAPLNAAQRILRIPRRKPSAEKLKSALALAQMEQKAAPNPTDWIFAKETVMLDALIRKEPVVEVEVQGIQVGPAVFLTNPAEFFVDFGLEIKRMSPFPFTFPVELANGCVGYVPTEEALDPLTGGGYETRLTSYSNLEPSAGRQMVRAAIEIARQWTPGPVPAPETRPDFRQAWPYGSVPPEV